MAQKHSLQHFLDGTTIDPSIFALRPDFRALLLVVDNIPPPNQSIKDLSESLLQEAEASARAELLKYKSVMDIPHIASWREAYKGFGAKPSKTRHCLEALTRRVESAKAKGTTAINNDNSTMSGGLPRVNYLTNIYNAIQVKNQIPTGGEDLDKYTGYPRLTRATGQETFETVSRPISKSTSTESDETQETKDEQKEESSTATIIDHPEPGEVIWTDEKGVTCRRWNWRQCTRTALTDTSKNVLFILDALDPISDDHLQRTGEQLGEVLKRLGPDVNVAMRVISASSS